MNKNKAFIYLIIALMLLLLQAAFAQKKVYIAPEASQLKGTSDEHLHLYVLDLLGADCMLLKYGDNNMLIDLGLEKQFPQLKNMLDTLDVKDVSVFNIHPHTDHLGGIYGLTENFNVKWVFTAFPEDVSGYQVMQKAASEHLSQKGIRMIRLMPLNIIPFHEDINIKILQNEKGRDVNECSAMLKISYKNAELLLTADISAGSQTFFYENFAEEIKADIIKSPHHGLEDLKKKFLSCVSPEFCFFTHGSANTKKMQETLKKNNIPFLFATQGIIHIETDGETLYVIQ